MSETKHTPGPWQYGPSSREIYVVASGSTICRVSPGMLASVRCPGRDEQEMNAHLITQAPELYEVLRALVDSPNAKENALWDRARIALAKVEAQEAGRE